MARKSRTPKKPEWISTSDLADKYSLSTKFFTDRIGTTFERGTHVINCTPEAWRPTYRWSVDVMHTRFTSNPVVADYAIDGDKAS